jgi:phosphoribosyl-ATP pyrophosphohydrolase/phosphoribosyl-AMP cyclohydrolase
MNQKQPDFSKGLIPAIIQDHISKTVLMLGYMNEESFKKTLETEKITFFSRSKNRLWTKGETSNNFLILKDYKIDCDQDTILFQVEPQGPTCHTGSNTCFDENNLDNAAWIDYLKNIIRDRKNNPSEKSYTTSLFKKGKNKVAQKVGEEAVELVIEAMSDNDELFKEEAADLLFHYLVLLEDRKIGLEEIIKVLQKRHK